MYQHIHKPRREHPTRAHLVDTVVTMLETQPVGSLTTEAVLEAAHASRSSLYHHFEDFSHLIEAAQLVRFSRYVDGSIRDMERVINEAQSREEARDWLRRVTRNTQAPEIAEVRRYRIAIIAQAGESDRFRAALGQEQARLTAALTELFRGAQTKGWMSQTIDPMAGAVLIQSYALGRIVDDISETHMDPDAWIDTIDLLVDRVFGFDGQS